MKQSITCPRCKDPMIVDGDPGTYDIRCATCDLKLSIVIGSTNDQSPPFEHRRSPLRRRIILAVCAAAAMLLAAVIIASNRRTLVDIALNRHTLDDSFFASVEDCARQTVSLSHLEHVHTQLWWYDTALSQYKSGSPDKVFTLETNGEKEGQEVSRHKIHTMEYGGLGEFVVNPLLPSNTVVVLAQRLVDDVNDHDRTVTVVIHLLASFDLIPGKGGHIVYTEVEGKRFDSKDIYFQMNHMQGDNRHFYDQAQHVSEIPPEVWVFRKGEAGWRQYDHAVFYIDSDYRTKWLRLGSEYERIRTNEISAAAVFGPTAH